MKENKLSHGMIIAQNFFLARQLRDYVVEHGEGKENTTPDFRGGYQFCNYHLEGMMSDDSPFKVSYYGQLRDSFFNVMPNSRLEIIVDMPPNPSMTSIGMSLTDTGINGKLDTFREYYKPRSEAKSGDWFHYQRGSDIAGSADARVSPMSGFKLDKQYNLVLKEVKKALNA
ncbi:hypothetical protein HN789_04185 [archaeon]|jgi:hypothetical protein|nr:hypothetical protein [archaeon]MBT4022477.1 hypothetical protein [archaeon]MBT4272316.1 hypothetical protein [archaeon]MBT4460425.1 hypothetical protein [archaeon]MBT4858444.1 hypothetical protein [archaeon]